MSRFASGQYALGVCDRCAQTVPYKELRNLIVNRHRTGVKVCDDCWEPDNPRNFPPRKTADAEALYEPRPDHRTANLRNITWRWAPVFDLQATGCLGSVVVEIVT